MVCVKQDLVYNGFLGTRKLIFGLFSLNVPYLAHGLLTGISPGHDVAVRDSITIWR